MSSISDYCLETKTGQVTDYVFVPSGLQGIQEGSYRLPYDAVISVGRKRVIAKEAQLKNAEQYSSCLQDKLTQAVEFVKEDYAQSQADLTAFVSSAQPAVSQIQSSAQQIANQAKETAADVQGHVKTTVNKVAEQVQEKAALVQDKVEAIPSEEASAVEEESLTMLQSQPPHAQNPQT